MRKQTELFTTSPNGTTTAGASACVSACTVYVGTLEFPYGRMKMSHMGSPDLKALHKMAKALGMKREWFQDHPTHPHYDVSKQNKKRAIEMGAVLVHDKELIRKCYPVLRDFMDGK